MHSSVEGQLPRGAVVLLACSAVCGRFIFNAGGFAFSQSTRLDEYKLATVMGIWPELLIYGFAILALVILLYVILLVPKPNRYLILLGGIIGAVVGFGIWNYGIGPVLLPV